MSETKRDEARGKVLAEFTVPGSTIRYRVLADGSLQQRYDGDRHPWMTCPEQGEPSRASRLALVRERDKAIALLAGALDDVLTWVDQHGDGCACKRCDEVRDAWIVLANHRPPMRALAAEEPACG